MIKDAYNRQIDYLRISITDRCNLRCRYCMPEDVEFIPHPDIMRYEEFLRLAEILAEQGIRKVKVTGGEPLVRRGCTDFIKRLKQVEGIENVTITTNGVLLEQYLPELADAGIDGINVSLDSLRRERYARITGRDEFERVWRGIEKAIASGIRVKLNCVPLYEYNADEIPDFMELARTRKMDVRFIEIMPIGNGKQFEPVPADEIIGQMADLYGEISEVKEKRGNGPAVYYKGKDFAGCVGMIGAVHQKFCSNCNRIRLTSKGFLKLCLYYDRGVDLREMLRSGKSDDVIREAVAGAIREKPQEHHFTDGEDQSASDAGMSQIGG